MSDPAFRTATELLADLAAGRTTSRELVDHLLARIERIDPAIGAVVTLDAEAARHQADAADAARARGEMAGPLHGLPMIVKNCFETAGMRTTAGSPRHESLSDYRIAAWLDDPCCPVGSEVRDVLEVAALGRAGARVDARARWRRSPPSPTTMASPWPSGASGWTTPSAPTPTYGSGWALSAARSCP